MVMTFCFLRAARSLLSFSYRILAVVLDLADGRNGVGGDLYQVQRTLAGHLEGLKGRHDAKLFAVFVDHADLAGADTFIGADKRLGGTFINWWNKSPPQRVFSLAMRCLGFRCNSQERLHRNVKYNTTNEIACEFQSPALASLAGSCMFARKLLERNSNETPHSAGR